MEARDKDIGTRCIRYTYMARKEKARVEMQQIFQQQSSKLQRKDPIFLIGGETEKDIDDDVAIGVMLLREKALSQSSTDGGVQNIGTRSAKKVFKKSILAGTNRKQREMLAKEEPEKGTIKYLTWEERQAILKTQKEAQEFYHEMAFTSRGVKLSIKVNGVVAAIGVDFGVENLNIERLFKKQLEEYECVRRKGGIGFQFIIFGLISTQEKSNA
ncbi:hypothetical protein HAX54_041543 [Datura stramonium]|uniref:Uncharacterized protein n=1 Tax=Datura stramonium TaxID=4076 RepID=A0ABS8RQ77_DATST|nr:hypothetical protein [Datura stramonium]